MNPLLELNITNWQTEFNVEQRQAIIEAIEHGQVVYCPLLNFELTSEELSHLDPSYCNPKVKNISFCPNTQYVNGVLGDQQVVQLFQRLMARFATAARGFVQHTLPYYTSQICQARTSLRMVNIEGRKTSFRKDDTRLHVDAFPSAPNQGQRILRVFSNINPQGVPRVWRVGDSFENVATKFLPQTHKAVPGLKYILAALKVTKGIQSAYDHLMLQIHHRMKADENYQSNVLQHQVEFAAHSTWMVMTDHVSHAAMSGQFLLEQTFMLPVAAMQQPERSPLKTLERLTDRTLV